MSYMMFPTVPLINKYTWIMLYLFFKLFFFFVFHFLYFKSAYQSTVVGVTVVVCVPHFAKP